MVQRIGCGTSARWARVQFPKMLAVPPSLAVPPFSSLSIRTSALVKATKIFDSDIVCNFQKVTAPQVHNLNFKPGPLSLY